MRSIDNKDIFDIIAIQQTLYDYCHDLDAGAANVTDYFTADCIFNIGGSTWNGHAGLIAHYAEDKQHVKTYYQDGVRTVRHALLNTRIKIQGGGRATVELIFLNFSAGGKSPFVNASAPTVVADTRLECRQDSDSHWRIHEFYATPLFFGEDPYLNTVLLKM